MRTKGHSAAATGRPRSRAGAGTRSPARERRRPPSRQGAAAGTRQRRRPAAPAPTAQERRRARTICRRLARAHPDARCSLDHTNPLELLIATILSAQCTDERVNGVTRDLFRKYPTAAHYAGAPPAELEADVRTTGFFRNKAKAIRGAGQMLADEFDGQVPDTMEALLQLPGVARKTANVVLGNAFGKATGVVVDTHVHRISRRLGLSAQKDPGKVEQELMALLPRKEWVAFAHRMIAHGRRVCRARRPRCTECNLVDLCPAAEV